MPPKADLPPRTVDHAYFAPGGLVQVDGSRLHDANSFAKAGLKTQYRWAPIIDGQKQVADMQPRMAKKEFAAEMKKHKAILTVLKKDAAVAKAQAKVKVAGIALALEREISPNKEAAARPLVVVGAGPVRAAVVRMVGP